MESQPPHLAEGVQKSNGSVLRILVVEDHEDTALSTSILLRLYGYEVLTAPDGSAGLEVARANQPDVVLLDLGLPKMSGWEVAERLRQLSDGRAKRPLLIAISGFGREADRRHSEEVGIDLHMVKPVDPEQLHRLLERFRAVIADGPI